MTRMFLFLVILASRYDLPLLLASVSSQPHLLSASADGFQGEKPLEQKVIEDLLKLGLEDENIARDIRRLGIAFRLTPEKLDQLLKLGAGEKTKQALEEQEELSAVKEFFKVNNPARRLILGREFLQNYPRSSEGAKIKAELWKAELDVFEGEYQTYSDKPDAAGLEKVLTLGRDLLQQRSDAATALPVISRLALATGKGMLGDFYNDLERSREYAHQALKLLETPTPPPGIDPQTYARLRASNLSPIYQCLGLYLIRQPVSDAEQTINLDKAITFLTKAAEAKDGPGANDPVTHWLRAQARELIFQKLGDEYRALPKGQRVGSKGQAICTRLAELTSQLILDYTEVIALSSRADFSQAPQLSQLKDQAREAINSLITGDRPCLGGRGGAIAELPGEEKRAALVIGVEDHLDKQAGKFNYAAADARVVANALIQHGGFRKEQVVLLATGEAADRQPSRSVILQQLAVLPTRVQPDGLLLIYFAGHNFEQSGKSYLLAADSFTGSESILADTAINIEQLKEKIRASGAGQIMLIFDSFRRAPVSENFVRGLSFDVRKNEVTAFATLFSADVGQRACESLAKKHGVFTSALLDASSGKAANKARGVTLGDLINYLKTTVPREAQRETGAGAEQVPRAVVEGYEAEDLVIFQPARSGQADARKPTPSELIRDSKTVQVRSKSVYMDKAVLETELRKLPEFQNLKLTFAAEAKEADLVIEVRLPTLTWNWNYTVIHRQSNTILFSGKKRGLTDSSVSPELAKLLVSRLLELRG